MRRYLSIYLMAIAMFWVGVLIIMIGHKVNLGPYEFWQATISRQVGWARWSEVVFAAINTIAGIMMLFFVHKNVSGWSIPKYMKEVLYAAIILFFLVSFVPYDPTINTHIAHQVLAFSMMTLAAIFVSATFIKNKQNLSRINLASGVFMLVIAVITVILFFVSFSTLWNMIFFVESFYIIGFFVFLPTIPVKSSI